MASHSAKDDKTDFKFLSSSSNESALALVPAQTFHVKGWTTHKHYSSHKMSQLLFKSSSYILFCDFLWL